MKLFEYAKDGGPESTVSGFFLFEFKRLFTIALLHFGPGSREAYHEHAFNSVSWLLKGKLVENHLARPKHDCATSMTCERSCEDTVEIHAQGWTPIITHRSTFHKVVSEGHSWVLTFRGPWSKEWREYIPRTDQIVKLTHGRQVV